jgi:hypothetical protein
MPGCVRFLGCCGHQSAELNFEEMLLGIDVNPQIEQTPFFCVGHPTNFFSTNIERKANQLHTPSSIAAWIALMDPSGLFFPSRGEVSPDACLNAGLFFSVTEAAASLRRCRGAIALMEVNVDQACQQ